MEATHCSQIVLQRFALPCFQIGRKPVERFFGQFPNFLVCHVRPLNTCAVEGEFRFVVASANLSAFRPGALRSVSFQRPGSLPDRQLCVVPWIMLIEAAVVGDGRRDKSG
jgi:hypothetical protein